MGSFLGCMRPIIHIFQYEMHIIPQLKPITILRNPGSFGHFRFHRGPIRDTELRFNNGI